VSNLRPERAACHAGGTGCAGGRRIAPKVALICNTRRAPPLADPDDDTFEEFDSPATIAAIAAALAGLGVPVEPVEADRLLPGRLAEGGYDIAFNIAEGVGRRCREAIPAAVCELLGLPFTGSDAVTLGVTLDKFLARRVVSPDLPVAPAVLLRDGGDDRELARLRYPVLVKPNDEGSSKGVRGDPIAADPAAAAARAEMLRARYGCPVLVEEFLPGTEVTVGVAGNGPEARVLGLMEVAPADASAPFVYSLEAKRDYRRRERYHVPPRLDAATRDEIARLALTAFRLLGCRDVARLDFRLDAAGRPHFLECNPLPGLDPETGDLVILSRATLPHAALVQGILADAARRCGVAL
jgi:D-alanine-D-alanine ligase